ncbi:hypothetical protein BH20ACT10_BH20ACT10_25430 [soil metagenome]|jgi:hypothetical protein|nr:hypothetical protein [Rubrobacter sp.]
MEETRRRKVRELLVPDGLPTGSPGRSRIGTVRILPGGVEAAEEFFARFEEIGEVEETGRYPGRFVNLGGGERIGLRGSSLSGEPTIDVRISYVPEVTKLKFE